eukprot:8897434-Pyramimonas_sp.AAC.1
MAHAPHSRRPPAHVRQWWKQLQQLITRHRGTAEHVVTLIDANAAVGSHTDAHVGPIHAEPENLPGHSFR